MRLLQALRHAQPLFYPFLYSPVKFHSLQSNKGHFLLLVFCICRNSAFIVPTRGQVLLLRSQSCTPVEQERRALLPSTLAAARQQRVPRSCTCLIGFYTCLAQYPFLRSCAASLTKFLAAHQPPAGGRRGCSVPRRWLGSQWRATPMDANGSEEIQKV
jgi:hypothetical protein